MNEEFVQTKADYGSRQIEILGPDDVKFVISPAPNRYWTNLQGPLLPATDHLLWRIHNSALRSITEIRFQLSTVESFDDQRNAFREPINSCFRWPPIQGIQVGAWTDFITFLRADGDHVLLWDRDEAPMLPWPNGDYSPTRRWRLTLRVTGLSKQWLIKLDLLWETMIHTFEIRDVSTSNGEGSFNPCGPTRETTSKKEQSERILAGDYAPMAQNEGSVAEQANGPSRSATVLQPTQADLSDCIKGAIPAVKAEFRRYAVEIQAPVTSTGWANLRSGTLDGFEQCFHAMIRESVAWLQVHNHELQAPELLIMNLIESAAHSEPALPTAPWMPNELFEYVPFRERMLAAIRALLASPPATETDDVRPQKAPSQSSHSGRRRGRRRDDRRRAAIHDELVKHGDDWRDHLGDIFTALDQKDVELRDYARWEIDLGDGQHQRVQKWEDLDLASGDQRRQIIDFFRKYR